MARRGPSAPARDPPHALLSNPALSAQLAWGAASLPPPHSPAPPRPSTPVHRPRRALGAGWWAQFFRAGAGAAP